MNKNALFKHLVKINDIYFISEIIKASNQNFELFFNKKTNLFEIHDCSKQNSFMLSFSKYPNQNLVEKIQKTSTKNKNLFKEIEQHNQSIFEKKNRILLQECSEYFDEILKFGEKTNNNISEQQIKKIIEKG